MRSLQGALIIAGVFQVVVGFFGIWRVFIRFLSSQAAAAASSFVLTCCTSLTLIVRLMHGRFLSPLAAVPFVTLSALGLFYFAFPGVRMHLLLIVRLLFPFLLSSS